MFIIERQFSVYCITLFENLLVSYQFKQFKSTVIRDNFTNFIELCHLLICIRNERVVLTAIHPIFHYLGRLLFCEIDNAPQFIKSYSLSSPFECILNYTVVAFNCVVALLYFDLHVTENIITKLVSDFNRIHIRTKNLISI